MLLLRNLLRYNGHFSFMYRSAMMIVQIIVEIKTKGRLIFSLVQILENVETQFIPCINRKKN